MKNNHRSSALIGLCGAFLFGTAVLNAADVKAYQVTGPVLDLTPTTITVQKGDAKWELARTKNTKVSGDLKVGSKVTIYYKMIAEEVEVKDTKAKEPAKSGDSKAKKAS